MSSPARKAVTVVGIGDDGCKGLSARARDAIFNAAWLVGGERHLTFFPEFPGERIVLGRGTSITAAAAHIATLCHEHNVCVLASGDPLFFGVGALVIDKIGAEHVTVIPHPSSVQWACARAGLKSDDVAVISLHGRDRAGFATRLRTLGKVAVLTDADNHPAALAQHLIDHGHAGDDFYAVVCENLCGPGERTRRFGLAELAAITDIGPLNVVLFVRSDPTWAPPAVIPHIPEDAYAKRMPKKGLITKREVRTLSLAALGIGPRSVIWDVGAGSGSIAIEAAMLAREGRAYAIEVDPESVAICGDNLRALGVDNVEVIAGRAPEALLTLEAPNAVFIGGSKGSLEPIIDVAWERLRPGGRLVVNAITLENVNQAYQALRPRDPGLEVSLVQIARAEPLAHYLRYEALNPIQIFAAQKRGPQEAVA
ncbi:MAG TPA: precorrin-6y C5,15-methyltransferase (decarboxylating) subunit CbiE [Polyangia bacterium]